MINKNTRLGKMIDRNRVVYECLVCRKRFIGDADTDTEVLHSCGHETTLVIVENLLVLNK